MLTTWSKRDAGARAALICADKDTGLAVVQRRKGERPLMRHCCVHPAIEIKPEHVLGAMIPGRALARTPVSAILSSTDYQLVQVEAPEVPAAELRAAVRWKLRDFINFPLEQAVIDILDLPEPPRHAAQHMLAVVAARSDAVERAIALLAPRARAFDVIDIPELCLRNLATLLPQDEQGVAVVALGPGFAQLLLTRRGLLYLTRRIELSRHHELSLDGAGAESIDSATLALEIQRSLDYYESHFDLPPINDLVLAPADSMARGLAAELRTQTSLTVELLDLERMFELADGLEFDSNWLALLALGGALRGHVAEA